jgi:hypothetical protein
MLGEKYMQKIITVGGLIGSGKDTIADYLIEKHQFTKLSFASSLKDAVAVIFGWDRILLDGISEESRHWREQVDPWWATRLNIPNLTPRWVLQHWGTEVCRQGFHEDIWVASLENKIRQCKTSVVITDARFANELTAMKKLDATLIRVERGPNPDWYYQAARYNIGLEKSPPKGIHASEYSSVGLDYDYYVYNNGTKQEMNKVVDLIVHL